MAEPNFTIGFETGQRIREILEDKFHRLEDGAFTYLNEILAVAKKAFKSSKIEVLPKTPGIKRNHHKIPQHVNEEENNKENDSPAKNFSLQLEADDTRPGSPIIHAGVKRAAMKAATTSQAKRKRQINPSKKNKSSPIACIEKLVLQETLELERNVMNESSNSCFTPDQRQNIGLINIKPNFHACEVIHLHENDTGEQNHGTQVASPLSKLGAKTNRCLSAKYGSVRRSNRIRKLSNLETSKSSQRSSRSGVRKTLKMLKSHQVLKKHETLDKKLTSDEEETKEEECNMDVAAGDDASHDDMMPRSPSPQAPKIIHSASFLNKNSTNSTLRPAIVATTFVRSCIQRNTPGKPTMVDLQERKKKAIEEKEQLHKERLKIREQQQQKKMEELKRKREERIKKVEKQREMQHVVDQKYRMLLNQKMKQKEQLLESLKEDRLREDKEKQKIRQQKLQETEERCLQEQKEWEKKLQNQQEEERRHHELLQKRKELEEFEHQKVQEESQKIKDKLAEIEHEADAERLIDEEKEREKKMKEREKMLAQEKTEKERIELEKKQEREFLKKELKKQKEVREICFEEKQEEKKTEEGIKKLMSKHNVELIEQQQQGAIPQQGIPKPNFNEMSRSMEPHTETCISTACTSNPSSYEMTPVQMSQKSRSEDNYDISDIHSSDSTDNEDAPRKIIPSWAEGRNLKAALINQHFHPPNLEKMFPYIEPPDLNVLFVKKRPRFNKRTSSAQWNSPVLPPYKI